MDVFLTEPTWIWRNATTPQQRFFRECMRNDNLHDRNDELTQQNKQLTAQNKQSTQALETLKQAFRKENVEAAIKTKNPNKSPNTIATSQHKWSQTDTR